MLNADPSGTGPHQCLIHYLFNEELHVGCGGTNTSHVLQIISETTVLYIQKLWNSLMAYKAL